MEETPFKFKEFTVQQDKCAMKIGTDAVLLGAWAKIDHQPEMILDIGSGTGVLALMLAQRTSAQNIEAIEIDDLAFEQCVENFENSPWSDRLFCYHASLIEFTEEAEDHYDLIMCNPPFYSEDYQSDNEARNMARFETAMPFEHLLHSAGKLLSEHGHFNVIIPYKEEIRFLEMAKTMGLFPNKITRVKGNPNSDVIRSLIDLTFQEKPAVENILIIEKKRHSYTSEYTALTKEFYLKM